MTDHPQPTEEQLQHAEWQLEREVQARQTLARGAGLALVELSALLETGDATVDPNVDTLGMVLLAYAARARRLLRAAYRLLDAGEAPEAVPLIRILLELTIVASWLRKHPERFKNWTLRDHDRRDLVLRRVIAELREYPDSQAGLEGMRKELAARRAEFVKRFGELEGGIPKIEQMATDVGIGLGYQLAYRVQSQSDVHATPLMADAQFEQLDTGELRLLARPSHGLSAFDQYALGAHALLDVLVIANEHLPQLLWRNGLAGITAGLVALRESDPGKSSDPVSVLMSRRD